MSSQNADLLQVLTSQLDAATLRRIGAVIGADPQTTSRAVSGALPLLLGALQRNAAEPAGAGALFGALTKDHDGSLLDNLGGFLGGLAGGSGASGGTRAGAGAAGGGMGLDLGEAILGHVLGNKTDRATTQLGRASGLDPQAIMKLLAVLAPIVMAALGKVQRQQGLNPGDLSDVLGEAGRQVDQKQTRAPGESGLGDLVGSILDRDGDGSSMDDLARIGTGVLGSLLGGGNKR